MAYFILNLIGGDAKREADALLRTGSWPVATEEVEPDPPAAGDLALIYRGAPERVFIGRAAISSVSPVEVVLDQIEEWDPPVPMDRVLAQIDQSAGARADFDTDIVQITEQEFATALRVANR